MNKEKQKIEAQEEQYQQQLSEMADTNENKDRRDQIIYSHRLLQIRLKKMSDQMNEAQRTRHNRRMKKEQHPTGGPPTTKSILSVQPKDNVNYPDSMFYKNMYKNKKTDLYSGLFDIPKYSTAPVKPVEERKKITPSLPTCCQTKRKIQKGNTNSHQENGQTIPSRNDQNQTNSRK